jgi:uncharacterized RDD family membrane protein YckC
VTELPSYPEEAAEREALAAPTTGEAAYASWLSRVGAYLLDTLILLIPLAIILGVIFAIDDDSSGAWAVLGIAYVVTLLLPFVYFTVLHGNERGQTYGKRAAKIRVISEQTGGSIGYGRAFGRYGIMVVFGFFFLPIVLDYLWPLWDSKNQALHDKVVGSIVVRAGRQGRNAL